MDNSKEIFEMQARQLASLRRDLALQRQGHRELSQTVDAICIAVALKFGAAVGENTREAVLPAVDVGALTEKYILETEKLSPGKYLIRAVKKDEP